MLNELRDLVEVVHREVVGGKEALGGGVRVFCSIVSRSAIYTGIEPTIGVVRKLQGRRAVLNGDVEDVVVLLAIV